MKNIKKILYLLMAVCVAFCAAPLSASAAYSGGSFSKSIRAENLVKNDDGSYTSKVTLSIPSATVPLATDIVFVVDASDCSASCIPEFGQFLDQLVAAREKSGAQIKLGVVFFKGNATAVQELGSVDSKTTKAFKSKLDEWSGLSKSAYEAAVKSYLKDLDKNLITSGSNLDSGLDKAAAMLDADTSVANERKYMISISDGITYMFDNASGNVATIYGNTNTSYAADCIYTWDTKYDAPQGSNWMMPAGKTWDQYYADVEKEVGSDGSKYVTDYSGAMKATGLDPSSVRFLNSKQLEALKQAGYSYVTKDEIKDHACSTDRAIYECVQDYNSMKSKGYKCYAIQPDSSYGENSLSHQFMNALAEIGGNEVTPDFSTIKNDVLYTLGSGSYLVNTIGSDFDFVNNMNDIKLSLSDKALPGEKKDNADGTTTYTFDNGNYVLTYYPDGTGDPSSEHYVLKINTNVSNFSRLKLSYKVKLTKPETKAGTYGKYDADGSHGYATLKVTDSTVLYPTDSNGTKSAPEEFQKPTVSYKVEKKSNPGNDKKGKTPGSDKKGTAAGTGNNPATGDNGFGGWSLIAAGAAMAITLLYRRKAAAHRL
ncbi:MAG: vWA domain-containing protein [Anaerovoracaceae bacterium]|jgi:hypothetical protein